MTFAALEERDFLLSIWQVLRRMELVLTDMVGGAPPVIEVPALDLSDLAQALSALSGPDFSPIVRAIAEIPQYSPPPPDNSFLQAIVDALEKLEFRMKGMGAQAYGGGSVSLAPGQLEAMTLAIGQHTVSGVPLVNPVTTSGDTTIYTPALGRKIRLRWLHLATPETNTAEILVTARFGASVIYKTPMTYPAVFSHSMFRDGGTDQSLILNLDAAQTVYTNIDVEEI